MTLTPISRGFRENGRISIAIYALLSTYLHFSFATSLTIREGRTTAIHLSSQTKLLSYDKKSLGARGLRNLDESVVNDDEVSICIDETETILNSDVLLELESELANIDSDYCSSDDLSLVDTWKTCNYTEVVDIYNDVCSNEAGGKTLVFNEYLSGGDGEANFNINYFSRPFCASESCTAIMIIEYIEKTYEAWEEIESYSIHFKKDYSLVCANEIEDVIFQYQELEDVNDSICGYDDDYYSSSTDGRRSLNVMEDHMHLFQAIRSRGVHDGKNNDNRDGDEEEEGDDINYYGDFFACEATEEKIDEHKSICESEHIGGKQFLANIVFSSNTSDRSFIDYPFCIVDLECHDTTVLSSQITEMYYSGLYGESEDWAVTVTISTNESTNSDDHDVHDSFHIKSNFPSAHDEWCIQPENDRSKGTLDPRTDIIIRQCDEESTIQEWTFDNYGRISPVLTPYLCITKAAFNRLELNYCGSIEDTDNMFIHNAFEETIVWKKASHMVFTISDYDVDENDPVLLAERDRSLHGQEWKIFLSILV